MNLGWDTSNYLLLGQFHHGFLEGCALSVDVITLSVYPTPLIDLVGQMEAVAVLSNEQVELIALTLEVIPLLGFLRRIRHEGGVFLNGTEEISIQS